MRPGERLKPIREIKTPVGAFDARAHSPAERGQTLLEVRGLKKSFGRRKQRRWFGGAPEASVLALKDVSFTIKRGNAWGWWANPAPARQLSAKPFMRAVDVEAGEIIFHDRQGSTDLVSLDRRRMEPIRRKILYIFQDRSRRSIPA
jgi:peptide/nickel transport system ATP-binding protein